MLSKKLTNTESKVDKELLRTQKRELWKKFRESADFKLRRYKAIRLISLTIMVVALMGVTIDVLLVLLIDSSWFLTVIITVLWGASHAFVYFYVKLDNRRRIEFVSYLMVATNFLVATFYQFLASATYTGVLIYVWLTILAALLGLTRRTILALSVISTLTAGGLILAEKTFKLYTPLINQANEPLVQIAILTIAFTTLAAGILVLVEGLETALSESEQRAQLSLEASQRLTQTNQFGKQVTLSLNSIVTELNSTSRQQASGAQEQAAAVMEVTSSLTELGETARQIATNTNRVSVAAKGGSYRAAQVKEATEIATKTAERGQAALESSIEAIEDVRNGITALAERLMALTGRSKQISSIIALIKEIADETHLLALNAAIESAGSGNNGRRFAVVASEVKSLADRALEATTEVSQVIGELQGAVAAAVLASEETRKKTFSAVERSYQAGQVINELGQVVEETASSAVQIVGAVEQVATLSEEIRLATQQQESAIRQIIGTMEGVGMVAQENASAVAQVSDTVSRIDTLSNQLKDALDNATPVAALV